MMTKIFGSSTSTLIQMHPDRENIPSRPLDGKDVHDDAKDRLSAIKS